MNTIAQIGTIFCTDSLAPVTTDRVRTALENSGLDPRLARDLAKRYCFTRTKNQMRQRGLIDEVNETSARWTWQLSRRYREENRLGYEFEATFWYDKSAQDVGADNTLLLERVRELFARYGGLYMPSDVSKLVRRVFDRQNGMIPLRHHGVVYFVPAANRALMEKVASFVTEIGGECIAAEIGAGGGVKEKALGMLVESVRKELDCVVTELKTLQAQDGAELTVRKANNRWKELLGQLDRVKVFARSLSADLNDLLSQTRTADLDLALVAAADLDVLAALAHAGKVNGALGQIAAVAYQGDLPAVSSPRVQAVLPTLDLSQSPDSVLPCVVAKQPVFVEV